MGILPNYYVHLNCSLLLLLELNKISDYLIKQCLVVIPSLKTLALAAHRLVLEWKVFQLLLVQSLPKKAPLRHRPHSSPEVSVVYRLHWRPCQCLLAAWRPSYFLGTWSIRHRWTTLKHSQDDFLIVSIPWSALTSLPIMWPLVQILSSYCKAELRTAKHVVHTVLHWLFITPSK